MDDGSSINEPAFFPDLVITMMTIGLKQLRTLKCAQGVKRANYVVSHKWINFLELFSVIINTGKTFKGG